jgi:hypothetical protein
MHCMNQRPQNVPKITLFIFTLFNFNLAIQEHRLSHFFPRTCWMILTRPP